VRRGVAAGCFIEAFRRSELVALRDRPEARPLGDAGLIEPGAQRRMGQVSGLDSYGSSSLRPSPPWSVLAHRGWTISPLALNITSAMSSDRGRRSEAPRIGSAGATIEWFTIRTGSPTLGRPTAARAACVATRTRDRAVRDHPHTFPGSAAVKTKTGQHAIEGCRLLTVRVVAGAVQDVKLCFRGASAEALEQLDSER
jgi:hypothetical protein